MLINKKKILIFGSNGFLGHYTYNFLKKKKLQVIKIPKKLSTLYKLNKKIDIILHFAGSSKANKDSFYKNIIITLKVLNFIKKKSNKNTILFFFSSTNIYKKKKNIYELSKVFCEYVIIRYNLFFNINYSIIRLPNIFGYWPSKKNFSQDILNQLIASKKIIKVNNLNGSLETIYINDFLSNLYYVLSDISRFKNKIIDFRSDKKITLKNFLKNIIRAYDPKDKIVIKNLNKKNMNNSVNLDYCKIKKNYVIKNSKYSGKNIYNGIKKLINQSKLNGKN